MAPRRQQTDRQCDSVDTWNNARGKHKSEPRRNKNFLHVQEFCQMVTDCHRREFFNLNWNTEDENRQWLNVMS